MLTHFSTGITELEEANCEAVFELVGYVMRRGEAKRSEPEEKQGKPDVLSIGARAYKRVSADQASWLR